MQKTFYVGVFFFFAKSLGYPFSVQKFLLTLKQGII